MNYKYRNIIQRMVATLLVTAMFVESIPFSFALDAVSSIKSPALDSAEANPASSGVIPTSSVRNYAELATAYDIKKDSSGNVKSITYTSDNQPTQEELLALFDKHITSYASAEAAETAFVKNLTSDLIEEYALSQEDIQNGIELHEDAYTLQNEFKRFKLTAEKYTLSQSTVNQIVKLIAGGFSNSEATAAVISCSILGLNLDDVIAAKSVELQAAQSASEEDTAASQNANSALAQRLGLPVSILEEYGKTHKINETAIEQQYTKKLQELFISKASTASTAAVTSSTSDDSYAPEEIIGQPYTYESNGEANVTLNSGDYSYTETDLSIAGVNGLDLDIQRQFSSVMAATGTPYGKYDFDVMFTNVFCVNYRVYEWYTLGNSEANFAELQENYDWEDYSQLNVDFDLDDRWYATDQYNLALIDLTSSPSATTLAINPDGDQVAVLVCPVLDAVSPFFENACSNRVRDYSYTVEEYGLGEGWRFCFPAIEKYRAKSFSGDYDIIGDDSVYERRLILPDGSRYQIDFDGDEYSNLVGYTLEDMKMYNSGRGYAGASYTLEYQNGTKYHFNSSGKILAIVDAYDNEISFDYSDSDETEFVITDTIGNTIEYTNVSPASDQYYTNHSGESSWLYNIAYELTLNDTVIRRYYTYYDDEDDVQYLKFVIDEAGEAVLYRSTAIDYDFNSFVDGRETYTNTGTITWVRLREVTNPDGSILFFGTTSNERSIGVCGYQEYPRVRYYTKETTADSSVGEQIISCKYYDVADYTNIRRSSMPTYQTTVTDVYCQEIDGSDYEFDKTLTSYYFSYNHDLSLAELYRFDDLQYDTLASATSAGNWTNRNESYMAQCTAYTYDADHLPTQILTYFYNEDDTEHSIQNYEYEYNEYGQVVSQVNPNDQIIEYTYDDRYGQITRIDYEQNASNDIIVKNTLVDDGRKIGTTTLSLDTATQSKTDYTYDSYGNVIGEKNYTTGTAYNETQYVYTNNAWLSETKTLNVKEADGSLVNGTPGYAAGTIVTKVTYNDRGWPTSTTDGNGNTTAITYDAIGRVTSVTNADNSSTHYAYNTAGCQITVTDPLGTVTRNTYDPFGNLIEVYDVTNSAVLASNTYWDNQLVKATIHSSTGNDQTQYYYYDTLGREIENGYLNGNGSIIYRQTTKYDDGSAMVTKTVEGDQTAQTQKEVYYLDEMEQVIESRYYYDDDWESNSYTYDYMGNLTREELYYSKQGGVSDLNTYTYDVFGNVLTATDSLNNTVTHTYDLSGNQITSKDANSNTTTYTYDALNRLLKLEQPFDSSNTAVTTYSYDGAGNILKQESSSNVPGESADTRVVEYEYDDLNQVVTAAMYAPDPNYTQYFYDATGNLLRVYTGLHSKLTISGADSVSGSDSDYAVTKYAYDNRSRMIRMTDALGQTETYSYDKNGQVTSKTDRNGNTTSYSYNYMGQPVRTEVKNSAGTVTDTLTYSYAKTGALQSQSNGEHTTSYYYDAFGRVIEESTDEQTIYNTYDTMGNRTDFNLYHGTKQISSISYDYDSNGRMISMDGNGTSASYTYDANGNRTSTTYGNGNATTYTYNAANYPVSVVNKNGTATLSSFHYVYALDGNVASKTDHTGKVTEYSYDGMNRLTEEVQKENDTLVQSYAYTFDDFNNRETLTAGGEDAYTVAYSYDANNRLIEDVKTSAAETSKTLYFYDPNGNQIGRSMETQKTSANGESVSATDKVVSYEKSWYNGFNQLTGTKVDGIEAAYTYAPSGLRLSKTIGETTIDYALDGDNVAAELNGDTVTALYNRGVELAGSTIGSTTSYYLYNAHGDVVNLTNTSGAVTKTYEYDAFGNEVDPSDSDTNPYRYCGEYFDAETGRIYLRARYYDPVIGRMLAEDPIRAGYNWYSYCDNNPILFIDPLGLDAILINKPVDNITNKIGVEHMGAFFQDSNNDWWFFFWGNTVQYVKVDDSSIFNSLQDINDWLINYQDPNDPDLELLNPDNPYRDSVYIKGDFTASHNEALSLRQKYLDALKTWDGKGFPNQQYNLAFTNCGQVTMRLFMKGTLPSGTNVGQYMNRNGYGNSAIPNWNMINMQKIFYNHATNLASFNIALQEQRNKYEGKNSITQRWYSGLKANIDTIS